MKKNTGSIHKSLGIASPWEILEDQYDEKEKVRRVTVTCTDASSLACPECNQVRPFYDLHTPRSWRHLDTCKYRTELIARIPRVKCAEHGILTVQVPWASRSSRFTFDFEEMVIGFHLGGLDRSS